MPDRGDRIDEEPIQQGEERCVCPAATLARLVAAKRLLARIVLLFEQLLPLLMPILSLFALYLSPPGSASSASHPTGCA
jgi:hypothetical protein